MEECRRAEPWLSQILTCGNLETISLYVFEDAGGITLEEVSIHSA